MEKDVWTAVARGEDYTVVVWQGLGDEFYGSLFAEVSTSCVVDYQANAWVSLFGRQMFLCVADMPPTGQKIFFLFYFF